jgi:hypothetical protein
MDLPRLSSEGKGGRVKIITAQGPLELANHKPPPAKGSVIGDNQPDAFTLITESIEDLLLEAGNFLDGAEIENEEQEAAVASILTRLRREANAADDLRKAEKKPHDVAGKAVQAKWAPLLSKADIAVTAAKNALTSFLRKKDEAQRAAAQAASEEASRQAEAAAQAAEQASPSDLAGMTTARVLQENAAAAQRTAERLSKARPQARGGERAVGLKSVWTPILADSVAALKHYRARQPEALKEWLLEQAFKDVRAGAREIPGFTITETKEAV